MQLQDPWSPDSRLVLLWPCTVGAQARLMSHALRKITANASKCHCTVLFLNQLRFKVGQSCLHKARSISPVPARFVLHCMLADRMLADGSSGHHGP
jgi:RecA/RadA recombinase